MTNETSTEDYSRNTVTHPCIIELSSGQRIYAKDRVSLREAIEVLIEVGINFHFPVLPGASYAEGTCASPARLEAPKSLFPNPVAPKPPSKPYSYYKELYLSGMDRSLITDSCYSYNEFVLNFFEALVGDKPIEDINEKDIETFMDGLEHLPLRTRTDPDKPEITYKKIIARSKKEKLACLGKSSQAKYFGYLKTFFNHLLERKIIVDDPFAMVKKDQYKLPGRTKESFSDEDVLNIFDPKHDASLDEPQKYWAPLICFYHGMRINEVVQLYLDDIVQIDGIWCFHISRNRAGQRIKTPSSARYVPIHSKFLDLGFFQYVEDVKKQGHEHLFPGLTWGANGPAGNVSIWFNRFHLRKRCGITNKKKTLHVFRHTFGTKAAKVGVFKRVIKRLFGHKLEEDMIDIHYIDPADVPECKEKMEEILFPTLQVVPYVAGRFDNYLKSESAKLAREGRQEKVDGRRQRKNKKNANKGKASKVAQQ